VSTTSKAKYSASHMSGSTKKYIKKTRDLFHALLRIHIVCYFCPRLSFAFGHKFRQCSTISQTAAYLQLSPSTVGLLSVMEVCRLNPTLVVLLSVACADGEMKLLLQDFSLCAIKCNMPRVPGLSRLSMSQLASLAGAPLPSRLLPGPITRFMGGTRRA